MNQVKNMKNNERDIRVKKKDDQNQKYEMIGKIKNDQNKGVNPLMDKNSYINMNIINNFDNQDDILDSIDNFD